MLKLVNQHVPYYSAVVLKGRFVYLEVVDD